MVEVVNITTVFVKFAFITLHLFDDLVYVECY